MSARDTIEVKSTDGDSHLGGRDIDAKIVNWLADTFMKENGVDLKKDPLALQRLDEAAEKAKIELSTAMQTEITFRSSPAVQMDRSTCSSHSLAHKLEESLRRIHRSSHDDNQARHGCFAIQGRRDQ
jgi:molecular chaperone DnaK (HSP70)